MIILIWLAFGITIFVGLLFLVLFKILMDKNRKTIDKIT